MRGCLRLTLKPALSASWLLAVVLTAAVLLSLDSGRVTRVSALLLAAPLLPLLGLALSCSRSVDPRAELMASMPTPWQQVTLLRAGAVVTAALPPLLLVSWLTDVAPLRWLIPALALLSLSLSLRLGPEAATGCAAAVWSVVALGPAALTPRSPLAVSPDAVPAWAVLASASLLLFLSAARHDPAPRKCL